MASFSNKKFKRNLNESNSSDDETEAPFPKFIIIESNSAPITNLTPITVKKLKNQTLLVEVEKRKHRFSTENDKVSQYQCQNLPSQIPERK